MAQQTPRGTAQEMSWRIQRLPRWDRDVAEDKGWLPLARVWVSFAACHRSSSSLKDPEMVATAPARTFVPKDLVVNSFADVEPLYQELLKRAVNSRTELEKWLRDFSELTAVVDEVGSRRYIDKSCHTDDAQIEKRYMQFVEEVEPKIKPLYFELQKKYLDSPYRAQDTAALKILSKKWKADVEMFREENIPLETQVVKLNAEYDKICGAMMVNFRGKELTMQQMARFQEEPDRTTREEALARFGGAPPGGSREDR
jgi:oligoendopeptidase F